MTADPYAALQLRFLDRCRQEQADLSGLLAADDLANPEARRIIHGLAGAAGTFGHMDLSAAAAAADEHYAAGGVPTGGQVQVVLDRLQAVISSPAG